MSTLRVEEGAPESWPDPPAGLSEAAAALDRELVWRRIESWIAWRWGERTATFVVEGGGCTWRAPLVPFVVEATQEWDGADWAAVELAAGPLGTVLGSATHYVFTGALGSADPPPADVLEAYRRLAEFFAAKADRAPGSTRDAFQLAGDLSVAVARPPNWRARAIHDSGAADLLRRFRRAP